jgi:hypothetical protein
MSIKDTSGIKEYLEDQGRAEILATVIKDKNPDKNSTAYQNAQELYNNAAGLGNGWTSGILLDARLKRQVDVSVEDYANSDAGKAISEFLAFRPGRGYVKTFSVEPGTAITLAAFVVGLIDKIEQQNDRRLERAIEALEREFSRARWTTFENTTAAWIDNKYKLPNNGN